MKQTILIMTLLALFCFGWAKDDERYQIKSGKIVFKTSSPMFTGVTTDYFDNYGERHFMEVESNINMGGAVTTTKMATIITEDKVYTLMYADNTYMEYDLDDEDAEVPEGLPNSDEYANDEPETKIGTGTVLGRTCDIYQSGGSKAWIWKGITLKQEVTEEGMTVLTEATSIDDNYKVSASKFKVPAGFTKQDNPMDAFELMMEQMPEGMEE